MYDCTMRRRRRRGEECARVHGERARRPCLTVPLQLLQPFGLRGVADRLQEVVRARAHFSWLL